MTETTDIYTLPQNPLFVKKRLVVFYVALHFK